MILHYDVGQLRELLKSFHILTGMRIVVLDDRFAKLVEYPDGDCAFCSLIRRDERGEERCLACDRIACEKSRETGGIYTYECHAGLSETVAPIQSGNLVIGYLMFGQVLHVADKAAHWEKVRRLCAGYDVTEEALCAAYGQKEPVEREQLVACAQLLQACAGYLWLQRLISLEEDNLPRQIDAYITGHLEGDLSVPALCREFGISRSKLYRLAKDYFGATVEEMVRGLRLEKAKELLAGTGLSVSEVAAATGFSDYNYFIKVFKKHTGQTPRRWRVGAQAGENGRRAG